MKETEMIQKAILNRIALALNQINAESNVDTDERYSCVICNLASAWAELNEGEKDE